MGPRGGDALNRVERGANYGWPTVSNGTEYNGAPIPDHQTRPEFEQPALYWALEDGRRGGNGGQLRLTPNRSRPNRPASGQAASDRDASGQIPQRRRIGRRQVVRHALCDLTRGGPFGAALQRYDEADRAHRRDGQLVARRHVS